MKTKILVLGVTGMLGHKLFFKLSENESFDVFGTVRGLGGLEKVFPGQYMSKIRRDVDANNFDSVIRALAAIQPDIVINCIGLIKQLPIASDPLNAITVNAQLPHRISLICRTAGARMIHLSSDCVFSGAKGNYSETDFPDADDYYGRTKLLGEVTYPHCVTIRTSIIGHELNGKWGLVEWFLSQKDRVNGFTKAIFPGFPTLEIARIINDFIIPQPNLSGLYHASAQPISKYDLLKLVARIYQKNIEILPHSDMTSDRSLDSQKFQKESGYSPPCWEELIQNMYNDYVSAPYYSKPV
jgi:dTDP-4-dehydrorhamnose reductase